MPVNMGIVFGRPIEIDDDGQVKTRPVEIASADVQPADTPQKKPADKPKRRVLPKSNHTFEPRLTGPTRKTLPEVDMSKPKPRAKRPSTKEKPRVVQKPKRVHTREPWPTIRINTALPRDFRIRVTVARKKVLREWAEAEMAQRGYSRDRLAIALGMAVSTLRNVVFNANRTVMSSISLYDYLRAYYQQRGGDHGMIDTVMHKYTEAMMQDRQAEWESLEAALEMEKTEHQPEKSDENNTKTPKD